MDFKEMVQHDIDTIIFNPKELGIEVNINGEAVTAIKDSAVTAQFGDKDTPGIFSADLVLYVRKDDLPGEIKADIVIAVDGEKYIVQSVNGVYNLQLVLKRLGDRAWR